MAKQSNKKSEEEQAPFFKDQRYPKIGGLLLIFTALILLFSFSSYLFTYRADQSEVINAGTSVLTDPDVKVDNMINRIGAFIGHLFVDRLFGIASFALVFLAFISGINLLLRREIFPFFKSLGYTVLTISMTCLVTGYLNNIIFPDSSFSIGGGFGDVLAGEQGILTEMIGKFGTGIFILLFTMSILVWFYNIEFDWLNNVINRMQAPSEPKPVQDPIVAATVASTPFVDDNSIFHKDKIEDNKVIEVEKQEEAPLIDLVQKQDDEEVIVIEDIIDGKKVSSLPSELEIVEPVETELEKDYLETNFGDVESSESNEMSNLPPYDPRLDLSNYKFPPLDLLVEHGSDKVRMGQDELQRNSNQIVETLKNYNIEISKIRATIGPTVTLYEIVPAPGVRISKIKNLEDDIALSLAALGIRIIAPIPGKGTIGIEVPNENKEIVSMRSIIGSDKFKNTTADLPIGLGKNIANEIFIADLAKMPHLLMAGATGQGKSVGINSILVSLLYKKHPAELKFVLVDPKKVELSIYSAIEKHYLAKLPGEEDAIITDVKKVVNTLNALCIEMDDRYDLLKKAGVRNLKEYNHKFIERKLNPEKGHKFMPFIVLIVDEFADLIMTAGKEVEMPIARLAQLARAIGIHLVLATQRPSVNIITGTIKANFPARISFKVTSKIDSRTILDIGGAEQLIGRGDMLLSLGSDLIRLQCGFLDTPEVDNIAKFVGTQQGYAEAFELPAYYGDDEEGGKAGNFNSGEKDEYFVEAARLIVMNQMGSTSLIQRKMKLGYNRAGRIMDQLEQAGVVGPNLGSKARDVNYKTSEELERFLATI